MTFAKDMKKAKKLELLLIDFLGECGYKAELNNDSSSYEFYDIITTLPKQITFEVKADYKSSLTGNLAIEHYNCKQNKPSGINISKADFWCHIVYENKIPNMYFAKREELLKFINENEPFKKIIAGGDDNANLFLYKKNDILGDYYSNKPLKILTIKQAKELFG